MNLSSESNSPSQAELRRYVDQIQFHDRGSEQSADLVLNEYGIEPGSTRERAFARITASTAYGNLTANCMKLWMPRLHAAEAVESRQCSFAAARDGTINPPLGLFDAARVRVWLDAMDRRFAGVRSWIP